MANTLDISPLLPRIQNLVDPKVEREINAAILRIYDFFNQKIQQQQTDFENKLAAQEAEFKKQQEDVTSLVNIFATPVAGSSSQDPLLQSFVNNFGTQGATAVFAGPLPSFRNLVAADIPNLDAAKITTGIIPLARLDAKIVKTDDGLTVDVAGAPNANTGKIILKDNAGNTVKVMTCA